MFPLRSVRSMHSWAARRGAHSGRWPAVRTEVASGAALQLAATLCGQKLAAGRYAGRIGGSINV
jgi:hypothetical protein